MKLEPLDSKRCERARKWRNQRYENLRTPFILTPEMQEQFYREVVCNRNAPHRYWAVIVENQMIGIGGLTNIEWENRLAEISLVMNPQVRGKGEAAVDLLLEEGFDRMGLKTICGECYGSNPEGIAFWGKVCNKYDAYRRDLINRKFWAGQFWRSMYFSIDADNWRGKRG